MIENFLLSKVVVRMRMSHPPSYSYRLKRRPAAFGGFDDYDNDDGGGGGRGEDIANNKRERERERRHAAQNSDHDDAARTWSER